MQISHANTAKKAPYGRFTQDQIVGRSLPLISVLNPSQSSLKLNAMHFETGNRNGDPVRIWLVDGFDPVMGAQVHLVWNADDGDLLSVSHTSTSWRGMRSHKLTEKEAIRITASWLTSLGISSEADGWHQGDEITRSGRMWRVAWLAPHRKLQVEIDSSSGDLIMAEYVRRPVQMRLAANAHAPHHQRL